MSGQLSPGPTARANVCRPHADGIAGLLLLLSATIELGLRESFYRISSEGPGLLMLALGLVLVLAAWRFGKGPWRRVALIAAIMVWLPTCGASLWPWPWGGLGAAALVVASLSLMAGRVDEIRWTAIRRALVTAGLIFVASQPILAAWRAPSVDWPSIAAEAAGPRPALTVVVLLDELNARAAGPIAAAMGRTGLPVLRRAILPAGDATSKVVPALFTGRKFDEVKPCGWLTVCSGDEVLDFERIQASRPDIDIVGFYMPYCAVGGLRSCAVLSPQQPYLDWRRWRCAIQRRSGAVARLGGEVERRDCAMLGGRVWADLGDRVEAAIWRAPVWQHGGLLFVHAPLPHPPGQGGGTLEEHYRANVQKAGRLVGAIADRLARQNRDFAFVVFSDHPLRAGVWCKSTQYRDHGCPLDPALRDDRVPLLVAGAVDPAKVDIESNKDVFQLIGAAPQPRRP